MSLKEDVKHARERWQAAVKELRDTRVELADVRKQIKDSQPGSDRREKLRKEQAILKRQRKALAETVKRRDKVRDELVKELEERQDEPDSDFATTSGDPHWGGSQDVIHDLVDPVLARHGIPITSRKRTETYGNPSSDHYVGNVTASAVDAGIANAWLIGDEVGQAVGVGSVDDYVIESFSYKGVAFRIQVIAATHGTGPHLHTGVRRI